MTTCRMPIALATALVLLPMSGCRVGPKYQRPPALAQAPPTTYKESPQNFAADGSGWKVAQPQDAMLRGKWWEIYNDPELNALEEKVSIDNQNIKQAFASFMEARTLIAQARSQLYPTIGVGPGYTRSENSANTGSSTGSGTVSTNRQTNLISLPFDVSWEPDLWGRIRNQIRAEQYNAQISAADLENVRLSEQANLAAYYFQIRGQDALQAILNETVANDQKSLDYTRAQYDTGIGAEISVVEATNTLQNAQAAATNLGVARAQYEHAIAVLIGTNPSSFSVPVKPLNATPPTIPIGIPSQLLERRPDIAASERSMAAANAQIGVATAAFYPTVTISASAGLESSVWKRLFDWSSRFWSVGPSISETIYEGGLRRATVQQYTEAYNGTVAGYRQTVLTAFQQVEDYLASVRILTQQVEQQKAAEVSARRFVELETTRYQTGIDPYINLVTAQNTLLSDQQALAAIHTQEMTASVQLIVALGGGWDSTQLPTPAQVSERLTPAETTIQR
ncbi:MAG TPA: efflux transporter outer membrane subunit [Acidobacteriaceae bacterium]|nr:efflux transporter outer membrane subunit [Acidobacteriaceae bacterium]